MCDPVALSPAEKGLTKCLDSDPDSCGTITKIIAPLIHTQGSLGLLGPFLFGLLDRIVWPQISGQHQFSNENFCTTNLKSVTTNKMILSRCSRRNNPNPASLCCVCLNLQEFLNPTLCEIKLHKLAPQLHLTVPSASFHLGDPFLFQRRTLNSSVLCSLAHGWGAPLYCRVCGLEVFYLQCTSLTVSHVVMEMDTWKTCGEDS